MCLAIPGCILEMDKSVGDLATVDVSGVRRKVNIGLLERSDVGVGSWVLIHVGFAMSLVDEQEARQTLDFLQQMGQAWQDEIQALEASRPEDGSEQPVKKEAAS